MASALMLAKLPLMEPYPLFSPLWNPRPRGYKDLPQRCGYIIHSVLLTYEQVKVQLDRVHPLQYPHIFFLLEELTGRDRKEGAPRWDGARENANTNVTRQRATKAALRIMLRGVTPLVSPFFCKQRG